MDWCCRLPHPLCRNAVAVRAQATRTSVVPPTPSYMILSCGTLPRPSSLPLPNFRLSGACGHVCSWLHSFARLEIRLCIGQCCIWASVRQCC
eukprot:1412706-Pyramimonas_sp.AAC.1